MNIENGDTNSVGSEARKSAKYLTDLLIEENQIVDDSRYTQSGLLQSTLSQDTETKDALLKFILAQQNHNEAVCNSISLIAEKATLDVEIDKDRARSQKIANGCMLIVLLLIAGNILLLYNLTDRLWDNANLSADASFKVDALMTKIVDRVFPHAQTKETNTKRTSRFNSP